MTNQIAFRFLVEQNKISLTKILREASLKTLIETETIDEELKKNNFNEDESFEMVEATISGKSSISETVFLSWLMHSSFLISFAAASKFVLSLTDPDFTVYKVCERFINICLSKSIELNSTQFNSILFFCPVQVDDPFKKLGPLAIFSAKRHWTVPRTVCLRKANNARSIDSDMMINSLIRPDDFSSRSSTSSMSTNSSHASSSDRSANNLNHRNSEFAEDYGFKLRNDSPVMISMVRPNSLADVSVHVPSSVSSSVS